MTSMGMTLFLYCLVADVTAEVRTERINECGVNCLFVALHAIDDSCELRLSDLREKYQGRAQGVNLEELVHEARARGYRAMAVATTLAALEARETRFVCIAHLEEGHFVILQGIRGGEVLVVDPPESRVVQRATFSSQWSGACALISATALESEESLARRMESRRVLRQLGLWAGAVIVLFAAPTAVLFWVRRRRR